MRVARIVVSLGMAAVLVGGAWAQATRPKSAARSTVRKPAAPSVSTSNAIATVGGVPILRTAFDERFRMAEQMYRQQSGTIPAEYVPIMRRQVLEGLIREKLLLLEAKRRGLSLSAEEAEREVRKDPVFLTNGRFDEAKYLAIKSGQPEQFRNAIAELQATVPALRLRDRLRRENAPDSASVRDRIADELSSVSIEYLALRNTEFAGEADEPTEAEVLAHYRAHASEHRRAEQVRVSILTVGQPSLETGRQANESSRRTWDARMERIADSLLVALKRGAPLAGVASLYGGLRTETIERGRFPKFWAETDRARDVLFSAAPGTVLSTSFPSNQGRLIVRVDEHVPAHIAPLREVSGAIRSSLRAARQRAIEDRELRQLYSTTRQSLQGNAYRIRYAMVDTATFAVAEPTPAEMDRYYRGHQADYATLDRATTSVITIPFAQARPDVRLRMLRERRVQGARRTADQLLGAWAAGKRDARLERLVKVREVGPVPSGGEVDSGAAGQVLTDSLAVRPTPGSGLLAYPGGLVVYHTTETVRDYVPPFEAVRPPLARQWTESYAQREEQEARALFESNPNRFRQNDVIHFSRLMVSWPSVFDVPLSQEEVETWHRTHLDKYGASELSRIRHILIVPEDGSEKADAKARQTADEVMKKLRAGEDFSTLALKYSDDEATKNKGGDLGVFRPGMMLPEFERIAFSMEKGELRGPVRTQAGWDILECLLQVPAEVVPLKYCYANVAVDAARAKGKLISRYRADSLLRNIRTRAQALAVAKKTGFQLYTNDHVIGTLMPSREIQDYIERVEKLKPGQVYPEVQEYVGMGHAITWMDSIGGSRTPTWDQAKEKAIGLLREKKIERKRTAKRAELDSLLRAGWSFDSVAALWRGPELHGPEGPGKSLEGLGGMDRLDSLAFGREGAAPALRVGVLSDWISFPGGIARLRLTERQPPDPSEIAARFENDYRTELERNFRSVFDRIRRNFPVVILDPDLRLVDLPELEAS
jgi:hypothetical protein